MSLTDEQRRRIEDNRARAKCRLRERRSTQSPQDSAIGGDNTNTALAGGSREGTHANSADAGGPEARGPSVGKELTPEGQRDREGGASAQTTTTTTAAVAAEASAVVSPRKSPAANGSTRLGGGRARGSRAGGGGGAKFSSFNGRGGSASGGGGVGGGDGSGGAGPAAAATLACEGCGSTEDDARVDKELLEGFGVTVCRTCKLSRDEFQCVTKKEAKDAYLLPEGTIAVLKFIERDNPHHSSWTKMKLYLRREVAEYSYKRWGSEDGLAAEKARRDALKYDRSLARTKGVFKRPRSEAEEGGFAGGYL